MSVQDQTQSGIEFIDDSMYEVSNRVQSALPESHFTFGIGEQPLLEIKLTKQSSLNIEKSMRRTVVWNIGHVSPQRSSTARIFRVPETIRETHDYETYFVPKVVSIGPYHFGKPQLELLQKRKPYFAEKLISGEDFISLYEKLVEPDSVNELRNFYEENSTTEYCDEDFTKMMLLDACFILYFINLNYKRESEKSTELKSNEIYFVRRDLFLLENQIPFKVLKEVIGLIDADWLNNIKPFIDSNCFVTLWPKSKRKWQDKLNNLCSNFEEPERNQSGDLDSTEHLLGAFHAELSKGSFNPSEKFESVNFGNVTELVDVGIHFKPIKGTRSLTCIEYAKNVWPFSATVKLPPIVVSDYTKPMLLNLIAYETCCRTIDQSWVISYVCLLESLIDDAEDVKVLRKAWVLENFLSSDKEVAELFNGIAINLVPSSFAYLEAKQKMQAHYRSTRNTLFWQLKNGYFKNPWAIFALLGALLALFLTGFQTYYAIWSPKSTCDDLCMFLKMNHHL